MVGVKGFTPTEPSPMKTIEKFSLNFLRDYTMQLFTNLQARHS